MLISVQLVFAFDRHNRWETKEILASITIGTVFATNSSKEVYHCDILIPDVLQHVRTWVSPRLVNRSILGTRAVYNQSCDNPVCGRQCCVQLLFCKIPSKIIVGFKKNQKFGRHTIVSKKNHLLAFNKTIYHGFRPPFVFSVVKARIASVAFLTPFPVL
jgi:hypothetical protein